MDLAPGRRDGAPPGEPAAAVRPRGLRGPARSDQDAAGVSYLQVADPAPPGPHALQCASVAPRAGFPPSASSLVEREDSADRAGARSVEYDRSVAQVPTA